MGVYKSAALLPTHPVNSKKKKCSLRSLFLPLFSHARSGYNSLLTSASSFLLVLRICPQTVSLVAKPQLKALQPGWQKTPYDTIVIAPLEACNGYGALREFRADPHTHTQLDVAAHVMADDSLYHLHAAVGLTIAPYEDDITGEAFDPFDDSIALLPLCEVLHRLLPSAAARKRVVVPAFCNNY